MTIKTATNNDDILKCLPVLKVLRPHIDDSAFVAQVTEMMDEGYQLAYVEEDGTAVAAIGFRYLQFLFNGKHIYIDDLITMEAARGKGYGGALLDHVTAIARAQEYKTVTLDSGHHRFTAHRLYLNKGFNITAHHFIKTL